MREDVHRWRRLGYPATWGPRLVLLFLVLTIACGPSATGMDSTPIDVSADPVQKPLEHPSPVILRRGGVDFTLTSRAHYTLRGIVLSESSYHFDALCKLAPCDVAMCWGELVKGQQYTQLKWSQSTRWYWWTFGEGFGHENAWVSRWSSNTHIIPADRNLENAVKGLQKRQPAELEGDLVFVNWNEGGQARWWRTSLRREDTGNGSCEILYLTRVRQGGKVFE